MSSSRVQLCDLSRKISEICTHKENAPSSSHLHCKSPPQPEKGSVCPVYCYPYAERNCRDRDRLPAPKSVHSHTPCLAFVWRRSPPSMIMRRGGNLILFRSRARSLREREFRLWDGRGFSTVNTNGTEGLRFSERKVWKIRSACAHSRRAFPNKGIKIFLGRREGWWWVEKFH